MKETFDLLSNNKHSYKGHISEDNRNKEEYEGLNTRELNQEFKDEIKRQDDRMVEITNDIGKGIGEAKNLNNSIIHSNEKIKEGIEHIELADSNIIKLNNRFLKYLGTSSPCRLLIFFIVEIVIAVALIIVFTKVGN